MTGRVGITKHNLVETYIQAAKNPTSTTPVDAQKTAVELREPWSVQKPAARTPQMSKPDLTHDESNL